VQLPCAAVAVIGGVVAFTNAHVLTDLAIAESMATEDLAVALFHAAFQPVGLGNVVGNQAEQNQNSAEVDPGPGVVPCGYGGGDRTQTPLRSSDWRRRQAGIG
jgi:hypothetical protein